MANLKLVFPGSLEYDTLRNASNRRFDIYPKAIFRPLNAFGVREALACINCFSEPFAVRSGGHCSLDYSSTSGILVDLSLMNQVYLDGEVAIIQPGARLGDIYKKLVSFGRVLPMGTCNDVGAGGHSLCGGIGYSVRKYGLFIDRIIGYQVVLADGGIIQASKKENSDLFFALRGYGSLNFGIITEIRARTFPTERVIVFKYIYPLTEKGILRWITEVRNSRESTFQSRVTPSGIEITGQSFSLKDFIPNKFIPISASVQYLSFEQAISALTFDSTPVPKKYKSRMFSKPLTNKSIDYIVSAAATIQIPNADFAVEIHQMKGCSETDILWKHSTYWMNLSLHWKDQSSLNDYSYGENQLNKLYEKLLPNADPFSYSGSIDQGEDYYGEYFEELKMIKRKYDPYGVFKYTG